MWYHIALVLFSSAFSSLYALHDEPTIRGLDEDVEEQQLFWLQSSKGKGEPYSLPSEFMNTFKKKNLSELASFLKNTDGSTKEHAYPIDATTKDLQLFTKIADDLFTAQNAPIITKQQTVANLEAFLMTITPDQLFAFYRIADKLLIDYLTNFIAKMIAIRCAQDSIAFTTIVKNIGSSVFTTKTEQFNEQLAIAFPEAFLATMAIKGKPQVVPQKTAQRFYSISENPHYPVKLTRENTYKNLSLVHTQNQQKLSSFDLPDSAGIIDYYAWSPDGQRLAVVTQIEASKRNLLILYLNTTTLTLSLQSQCALETAYSNQSTSVAWHPHNTIVAVGASFEATTALYDCSQDNCILAKTIYFDARDEEEDTEIRNIAFNTDGTKLTTFVSSWVKEEQPQYYQYTFAPALNLSVNQALLLAMLHILSSTNEGKRFIKNNKGMITGALRSYPKESAAGLEELYFTQQYELSQEDVKREYPKKNQQKLALHVQDDLALLHTQLLALTRQ